MKTFHYLLATLLSAFALTSSAQKLAGGDISLLPSYEEKGAQYFDHYGNAIPSLLPFLKEQGWNAMRVRLFVDPANATEEEKRQGVVQSSSSSTSTIPTHGPTPPSNGLLPTGNCSATTAWETNFTNTPKTPCSN